MKPNNFIGGTTMKLLIILIVLLALPFGLATKSEAEPLRPSITFDVNLGLDNSEFVESPENRNLYGFDYDFNQASMLIELPLSQFTMIRFGLERSGHNFKPMHNGGRADIFRDGLRYATYNVRLGFKLYLDGN